MAKPGQPRWLDIFVHNESDSYYTESESSSSKSTDPYDDLEPAASLPHGGLTNRSLLGRELGILKKDTIVGSVRRDFTSFRTWTGASKDVLSVAWGPKDNTFAIGASADHLDRHGIPYNRKNNLLYGDLNDSLFELSAHQTAAPPEIQSSDQPLTDPLFTTVSQVTFANHQPILYSAGYDKTVRVWDCARHGQRPRSAVALQHESFVDFAIPLPTRSEADPQLLATGQQSRTKPLQLFGLGAVENDLSIEDVYRATQPIATLTSERAEKYNIHPSAVQWGPDVYTRRFLLAGFAENSAGDLIDREGHLAIWDVHRPAEQLIKLETATEDVFDVAWQPGNFVIAAATTPRNTKSMTHGRDTKSVVRTWAPSTEGPRRVFELECPARDVNDLKFHPTRNLITASCTDGCTYVWDLRSPEKILTALYHGRPIETFEVGRREELDVGVRFSAWAQHGRYLYTGGSDGRLACWDILTTGENGNAAYQEVAKFDAGIMAGAFSTDETKLLLGLVKGSVELLSVGACSASEEAYGSSTGLSATEKFGKFQYRPAVVDDLPDEEVGTEGLDTARLLLQSGQLVIHPKYGVGQGPNYQGPWNMSHRSSDCSDPRKGALQSHIAAQQFDKAVRQQGLKSGGLAKNTQAAEKVRTDRRNARLAMQHARSRPIMEDLQNRAKLHPEFLEEPVEGPDTTEFGTLLELARFGGLETQCPRQDDVSPRLQAKQDIRRSAVDQTEPSVIPLKRTATDELNLGNVKRGQTPKPTYPQQGHISPRIRTTPSQHSAGLPPKAISGPLSSLHESRSLPASNLLSTVPAQQQNNRTSSLIILQQSPRSSSQRAEPQQVAHSHQTSGDSERPRSQPGHNLILHGTTSMHAKPKTDAPVKQPEVIDLCDSDDDEPDPPNRKPADNRANVPLPGPDPSEAPSTHPPGLTTSAQDFKQPTTPSRGETRSRSRNTPHETLPQQNASPRTPSERLIKRDPTSPSLQRSLSVIPSSPGHRGFEIPARIQRKEEPEG